MLCAKYDYKMDIAVKQEEAYEDGMNAGMSKGFEQGARETAIKNAINMLKEGDSPEKVSRCTGLSLEEVQKLTAEMK